VAHAAGLHSDADLTWSRKRNVALDNFKVTFRFRNLHNFHFAGHGCGNLLSGERVSGWMRNEMERVHLLAASHVMERIVIAVVACGQAERIRILAARPCDASAGG
jgi:hypothetical protein